MLPGKPDSGFWLNPDARESDGAGSRQTLNAKRFWAIHMSEPRIAGPVR
jgi:hypothetical protein